MAYNTGNPLGSNAPQDLSDNAEILDHYVNDTVNPSVDDRFGTPRLTLKGMEDKFNEFLMNSGYQFIGPYGAGLLITAPNQYFTRLDNNYRIANSSDLPYTTTGVWADEQSKFILMADDDLRQDVDQLRTDVDALTDVVGDKADAGPIQSSGLTSQTGVLWGRFTAGTGPLEPVTLGTNLSVTSGVLNAAGGSSSASDADRQNDFLSWIYQSKLFLGFRKGIKLFADGYKAIDGIAAGSSSGYSIDTTNGFLNASKGTPSLIAYNIAGSSSIGNMTGGGGLNAAFDNITSQVAAASARLATAGVIQYVGKDYGVGNTHKIGRFRLFGPSNATISGGTGTAQIRLYGSNSLPATPQDGTMLHSGTNANTTAEVYDVSIDNRVLYRYVWVTVSSPSNTAPADAIAAEVQFYDNILNNIVAVTTAQTVGSSNKGRAIVEYSSTESVSLNTDLTVDISCDGGATWTPATLTAVGTGQAGRLVAETALVDCTAGTSMQARYRTFNSKNISVYGFAFSVSN